jgi:hypothetical protein
MPRALRAALLAAATIGLLPGRAANAQDARLVVRSSVPLPGGAASLSEALGSPRTFDRAFILLDAARIVHENPPGESPETDARRRRLAAYLERVREGGKRLSGAKVETVPLPFTPGLWSDAIFDRRIKDDEIALAILEDRQASLLYRGLSALDDETLRALAQDRETLQVLHEQHAAVLAAFGGSLRVRDGAVQVPGGDEARPLWEALVKQPVSPPAPFVLALLAADGGRLAFFYDTAASLDERARRYVLGLDRPADARPAAVQALYQVFATAHAGWQVARRPFMRAPIDGALLFHALQLDAAGRPIGPMWPEILGRALEDLPGVLATSGGGAWLPADPARDAASIDPSRQVDAAWIAERILRPLPQIGRQRLDAVLFGQRVFPRPDPKDAADILLALRGRIVFPTLIATLERLGVREPALYARAVRHAEHFIDITNHGEAAASLFSLQACLAILDRSTRERTLAPPAARALAADLLALEPDASQSYRGAIGRWIDSKLLPAIWQATGESIESSSAEFGVLRAVAGDVPWPERPPVTVDWEGRSYHVNRGAAEFARLKALRENQGGNNLDQVIDVCRTVADALELNAADESIIGDMVAVRESLRGLAPPELASRAGLSLPDAQALANAAVERANAHDRPGALEALRPLVSYADALLADTLTSIVYAVYLGAPDSPALSGGNVAFRHDLGFTQKRSVPWQVPPGWSWPGEDSAGGWRVLGSLLGLDVGLSRLALRWLSADAMPPMPLLNANERRTLAESVALLSQHDFSDADRDRIAAALELGRARIASLSGDPAALDRAAEDACLSGLRREAIRWTLAHEPGRVAESLSLLEQFWLGGGADLAIDAWGMSALPTTGCVCLAFPAPGPSEMFAGRPALGLIGARLPDLALRAAQELHVRGLPAALAPGILAVAMNDLQHEAQPAHHDDWIAVTRYVRGLDTERFVDYISSLTAAGPLVPAESGRDGGDPCGDDLCGEDLR